MNKKQWIRAILFLVIFYMIYTRVTLVFTLSDDERNYQWVRGFFKERENSLDAVVIGSSAAYAYWQSPIGFATHGIAVRPFCCNSQPFVVSKYLIEDARKKQPDALYIVSLNTLDVEYEKPSIPHHLLNYYPLSLNKLRMTRRLAKLGNYSFNDSLEFYIPIIRYHPNWNVLNQGNFSFEFDGFKGASTYEAFLEAEEDLTEKYKLSTEKKELDAPIYEALTELLEYCQEENVNVLFLVVPRVETKNMLAQQNMVKEMVASRGFPVLDLTDKLDEMGLLLDQDFYNKTHTNLHGSIKVTAYLADYLVENYGFEDKRGDEAYSDWAKAAETYQELIEPYLFPGESIWVD